MFVELQQIAESDNFDFCIVGSGPAGITCALALASPNKRILLLEGGGKEYTSESQGIYRGTVVGDRYFPLDVARLRYFGGTSNHWDGWCRPLDEIDFEAKNGFPKTLWPIGKKDLEPYLAEASNILEIEMIPEDIELSGGLFKKIQLAASPPVRFAEKYTDELSNNRSIVVALNSSVVGMKTNGSAISAVEVVDFKGNRREISAKRYILACGGIENSRILLWCNQNTNNKIVKNPAALGRFWMEHLVFIVGDAIINNDIVFPFDVSRLHLVRRPGLTIASQQAYESAAYAPTSATVLQTNILNCRIHLDRSPNEGAKQMISNIACVAPNLAEKFLDLLGKNLICGASVQAFWEQEPIRENRIELSGEMDRLGVPSPILYWKKSNADLKTPRLVSQLFGKYIAAADLGRLRLFPWLMGTEAYPDNNAFAAYHHMGGTRMSDSPDEGVVDLNCKVFGLDNLYIGGSSVFPSGGHANPTLTIVQLALRLADHLRRFE
jgi:hypothetical protein